MSDAPAHGVPTAADKPAEASSRWRRVPRVAAVAAFAVAAFFILRVHANRYPPPLAGDVWEHWLIAESFHQHGTPDLRDGDIPPVYSETPRYQYPQPPVHPHAYARAPDGRLYGVHFWGYALSGVPAKEFLRRTGRSELAWPGLTNALWFIFALGVVLFGSSSPVGERLALVGLASAGPAWVYVGWPGPELYTWAFVLIAVACFRDRRYVWSGIAVGLGALQNPPVILFAMAPVLAAALERRWRAAAGAAVGGAIGMAPYAFFLYHFGKPNLIAEDFVRIEFLSWVRTWSQLTDFNQGVLPYAPLLLVGAGFGAARLVYRRDRRGLLLLGASVAVALGTQVSRNWNSQCDGLQRYLVWLLPMFAAITVTGFGGRRLWAFAAVAVVVHASLVPIYRKLDPYTQGCLGHGPVARWVLTNCPRAYWVEPEVFVERTRQEDNWPMTPSALPVGYARPDGTVSKMLVDPENVDAAGVTYEVEPAYLVALRSEAVGKRGPFFVHPPRGAVRVRPPTTPLPPPPSP